MSRRPESPYKGLSAFEDSDLDALLFFGREREREIVVANLIAARLTVLYGPTGVGKSSLLRPQSRARSARCPSNQWWSSSTTGETIRATISPPPSLKEWGVADGWAARRDGRKGAALR